MHGTLYIVGTPIGNLQDITLRALETLKNVHLIACEDTRHTKILLKKYHIATGTTSYHKFNIRSKTGFLIDQLKKGRNIAVVSDAGMPGISDPGQELIKAAAGAGIRAEVIPGPSAVISALAVSGMINDRFTFEGFLPTGVSERKRRLQDLAKEERTMVLYEAPHRMVKTLQDLMDNLGDRAVCIARELTKKFEEVKTGKLSVFIDKYSKAKPRGEFVIVIEGRSEESLLQPDRDERENAILLVSDLIRAGMPMSGAIKIISKRLKTPRNELYRAAHYNIKGRIVQ